MPGTITFRPIEANLTHNTDLIGKMNPYCAFIVGDSVFKGQICKKGGKHPHWDDAVTIPVGNQSQVIVELFDKDRFSRDDVIGSFLLNLNELQSSGQSSRWYPLIYKDKPAGEILMQTTFSGQGGLNQSTGLNQGFIETSTVQPGFVQSEVLTTTQPTILQQEIITPVVQQEVIQQQFVAPVQERHIWQEQQQFVEPRTFVKDVDTVEMRQRVENIEVMRPVQVEKVVNVTELRPVMKDIEVSEPRVVRKEIEVIEPRVVQKVIDVIENVSVMKQVEVIENVNRMERVETMEPTTFQKTVMVTDYVPQTQQVTVSEPVHVMKQVEYVEPVIQTRTITKEIQQPIIVDEKITTSVGPASLVGERDIYVEEFARLGITQEMRQTRFSEWNRLRGTGYNDQQLEQHFQTQGWGPVNQYRFSEMGHHHHHLGHGHSQQQYGQGQQQFVQGQQQYGQGQQQFTQGQQQFTQGQQQYGQGQQQFTNQKF